MIAALSADTRVVRAAQRAARPGERVLQARTWGRLHRIVREEPVTAVVVDSDRTDGVLPLEESLVDLRRRFRSVALVLVARAELSPLELLRLGQAGISNLSPTRVETLEAGVPEGLRRGLPATTVGRVLRTVRDRMPELGRVAIRRGLEGAIDGWSADELGASFGWSRAHLSVRLTALGLPSAGHLLTWGRVLHAARWLADPGRTAESVGRQLRYANGSTFRRVLRNYVDATPTEIRNGGGLDFVLDLFLDECGVGDSLRHDRSVA